MKKNSYMVKVKGFLQLVRLPNIFTSMADILAGVLIVSGSDINFSTLFFLLMASSAIYGAGCVLNDICDRKEDACTRPDRPLPAAIISLPEAVVFCVGLFVLGGVAAAFAGGSSFFIAAMLIALVIVYDCLVKKIQFLGPLAMAGCRALNLLLGMSCNPLSDALYVFPLLSLVYVFFLTWLGTFETGKKQGAERWVIVCGLHLVPLFVLFFIITGMFRVDALVYLLLVCLLVGPPLWKSALSPGAQAAGNCVKYLVLAIPLLDAAYVAAINGYLYGLPVVFCLLPALILAKIFYVT